MASEEILHKGKQQAITWAKSIMDHDAIIVDFETTDVRDACIVQVGVINLNGDVLLDTLVAPPVRISFGAYKVHGISDTMVAEAPTFLDLSEQLKSLFKNRPAIAYNISFERKVLSGECRRNKISLIKPKRWECAMINYASFYGSWNRQRMSFAWQKLSNACAQQAIPVQNAHNAIADCQMTLALIRKMAATTA